jgi:hypothetical protein
MMNPASDPLAALPQDHQDAIRHAIGVAICRQLDVLLARLQAEADVAAGHITHSEPERDATVAA